MWNIIFWTLVLGRFGILNGCKMLPISGTKVGYMHDTRQLLLLKCANLVEVQFQNNLGYMYVGE